MDQVTREEFLALLARQGAIDDEIYAMRQDIKQLRDDTHEVVETFRTLSGGFRFFLWLGRIAAALTAIVGAIAVIKNGWFK